MNGANNFHSIHGGTVCAVLGDGSLRYLSSQSGGRDRRKIVTVAAEQHNKALPLATREATTTRDEDIKIDVTPFEPTRAFGILLLILHILVSLGLGCLADSVDVSSPSPQLYNNYLAVTIMMLVGFGYLMTFLALYGLSAVGVSFLITAVGVEISLLLEPLFAHGVASFSLSTLSLLDGMFASATFLISFGALLGKVSPTQTLALVSLESVAYCANKHLVLLGWLSHAGSFSDLCGTLSIHLFGAYFGLAAALMLGAPSTAQSKEAERSSPVSDVTSLIGTVFLWLYWPSFVAGALPPGSAEAELAIMHTVLALAASTIAAFAASSLLSKGRLRPVDIQNATLAGGVTIGAVADLQITPIGAIILGTAAGLVSVAGYKFVQAWLLEKMGLHDTCGVHNLHGMPALLGGLASVILPACIDLAGIADSGTQAAATVLTTLVALTTGAATGLALKALKRLEADHKGSFNDEPYWEVAV